MKRSVIQQKEDILEEHLRAVGGACAYQSDGWFHDRLLARMEAMRQASAGMPIRRAAWVLGGMALLLALNLWMAGSGSDSYALPTDPFTDFVQAYGMALDTETE